MVQRTDEEQLTPSGIHVVKGSEHRPHEGRVVAVGPYITCNLQVGTQVAYSKYAGHKVEIDNEEYLVLREDEILGYL